MLFRFLPALIILIVLPVLNSVINCSSAKLKVSAQKTEKGHLVLQDSLEKILKEGRSVYLRACASCHKKDGMGSYPDYPPVVNSDYVKGNPELTVRIILQGLKGAVRVHDKVYDSVMPPINLEDKEISNLVTFLLQKLDNGGGFISEEEVRVIREEINSGT